MNSLLKVLLLTTTISFSKSLNYSLPITSVPVTSLSTSSSPSLPATSSPFSSSSSLPATSSPTTSLPSTSLSNTTDNNTCPTNSSILPIPCIQPCYCYFNAYGLVTAKCDVTKLPEDWELPESIHSLDLSYNGLTKIPTEFFSKKDLSKLSSLSLRGNRFPVIADNAFHGLLNLTRLDLGFVKLTEWKGNISKSLPSLMYLDVTGNYPWIPTVNVLAIKTLREIAGVTWNKDCFNCTLVNSLFSTDGPDEGGNHSMVEPSQVTIIIDRNTSKSRTEGPNSDDAIQTLPVDPMKIDQLHILVDHTVPNMFVANNFFPNCLHVPDMFSFRCFPGIVVPDEKTKHLLTLPSQLFYIAYVLGAVGILLNISIIFIYVYSTNIRKINSMLLISNMAFCDILVGVYAIIIAKYNIFNITLSRGHIPPNSVMVIGNFCKVASVLFTVGQVVSVITALLLTIDKFLSIVYCMDPNRKLSRRLSLLVLALCWVGVILYAFSPEFSIMVYSPALLCTFPVTEMKAFIISVCLLVLFYLANIPLYVKIFIFVRRSSVRMGVRRDAALAKKIAVLILTNFIFFAVPMILIIIYSLVFDIHYTVSINDSRLSLVRFIVCYLMPIVCLCLNSCLNPFLCAFRQRQFRREFKKCMRNCVLSRFCKAISTIRSDSSVRTQPTRVEMYKLSNIDSQTHGV